MSLEVLRVRSIVAATVAVMLTIGAHNALATMSIEPIRELTEEEIALNSVERSDAIVVARLQSITEDFFPRLSRKDGSGQFANIAELVVIRRLKGGPEVAGRISVELTKDSQFAIDQFDEKGQNHLLFLSHDSARPSQFGRGKRSNRSAWTILESQYIYHNGFQYVHATSPDSIERYIRRTIRRAEPDSLSTLADIVIVGSPVGYAECNFRGKSLRCKSIAISQQLYGAPVGNTIKVISPVPGYLPSGEQLLYLKQANNEFYEPIGLAAGAQRIRANKVGRSMREMSVVRTAVQGAERKRRDREAR